MKKKFLFAVLLSVLFIFCMTYTLATDSNMMQDATNSIRDMAGSAENAMEDAAGAVSNTSKNVTGDMQEGLNNMLDNNQNNSDNNNNNNGDDPNTTTGASTDNSGNNGTYSNNNIPGNYTAERTATSTDGTLAGMNSTTWIWLIMAVLAIAIIALVYYYSAGLATNNRNNYHDDN